MCKDHPFAAVTIPDLPAKPRLQGITSILDKGLGPREVEELTATAGDWIDVVKFGWGTARVQPAEVIERKIDAYRSAGVAPATGGTFLEAAYAQDQVPSFLAGAGHAGFEIVEVSNGVYHMSQNEKLALIRQVSDAGFRVWSEVGKKDPREDAELTIDDRLRAIEVELQAGAEKVIMEGRETGTVGIYDHHGKPMIELMEAITRRFGIEKIVFEAPQKSQQVWLIHHFGRTVNLGNIPANEAIPLATLRCGLRGDTFADVHLPALDVYAGVGLTGALEARRRGGVIVLIDALRASATIIAALAGGMAAVRPVATAVECVGEVTAGERGGHKLPNVRHNNSPSEILAHNYRGKTLVLTTTNGVECLLAASGPGTEILVGTTLNRTAVAREAERLARERRCPITLLISGRHNRAVIEDSLAAGEILRSIRGARLHGAPLPETENLENEFILGESGRNLLKLGAAEDVRFCARLDEFDVVPVWRDGLLVPMHPVSTLPDEPARVAPTPSGLVLMPEYAV